MTPCARCGGPDGQAVATMPGDQATPAVAAPDPAPPGEANAAGSPEAAGPPLCMHCRDTFDAFLLGWQARKSIEDGRRDPVRRPPRAFSAPARPAAPGHCAPATAP